jgi:hypothetical protein
MNLGAFRSYGPPPEAEDHGSALVETISDAVAASAPVVSENRENTPMSASEQPQNTSIEEAKQDMPPPPRPKLTLKLGGRRASSQGSPE